MHQNWSELENLVEEFYAWALPHNKPLSFPEIGCKEDPNDHSRKAAWFTRMGSTFAAKYPKVKALVYFSTFHLDDCHDWPITTSPESLAAYKAVGKLEKFSFRHLNPVSAAEIDATTTTSDASHHLQAWHVVVPVVIVTVLIAAAVIVVLMVQKRRQHIEKTSSLRVALNDDF